MKSKVTKNKLTVFIYLLMRDEVTPGIVEKAVQDSENNKDYPIRLTNGHLARYAEEIAERLK